MAAGFRGAGGRAAAALAGAGPGALAGAGWPGRPRDDLPTQREALHDLVAASTDLLR